MFDILTAKDFYAKLLYDFADLKNDPTSSRHAINCATTAYHLHEWVWADSISKDYKIWNELGIRDLESFQKWLDTNHPWFPLLQSIANGSKHWPAAGFVDTAIRCLRELENGNA